MRSFRKEFIFFCRKTLLIKMEDTHQIRMLISFHMYSMMYLRKLLRFFKILQREGIDMSRSTIFFLLVCLILLTLTSCSLNFDDNTRQRIGSQEIEIIKNETNDETELPQDNVQFYVPSEKENSISVIDIPSNKVIQEIKTGERPANVVFANEKAFVTHRQGNSVGVINLKEMKMIKEIEVGIDPHGIALSNDQKQLYVTTVGDQYVYVIDTVRLEVNRKIDLGEGARTNYPYLHEDILYISDHKNLLVYAVSNDKIIHTYKVNGSPMVIRTISNGNLLYVASSNYNAIEVFNTKSGKKEKDIESGIDVTDFVINEEKAIMVVTNKNDNSVSIIDLQTDKVIKKIQDISAPKHISFNKDMSMVYVTLSGSNKVAVINLETNEYIEEIEVGYNPHGIHLRVDNKN